jgi:hypothetical protein
MTTSTSLALASLRFLAPCFAALALAGCAPEQDDVTEETAQSSEDVTALWKCDVHNANSQQCKDAVASAKLQAFATGRSHIVDRGFAWYDQGITYNTNHSFQGYRRDCSGFVSMAWEFTSNPNTALFPPFVSGKYAVELPSFDDLVPGDAINKTFRNPVGHVMLFVGWATFDHSQMFFLQHYSTGKPVDLVLVTRASLGDYIPIRSINASSPAQNPGNGGGNNPPPAQQPAGCGVLGVNEALNVNESKGSCDGRFALVQQGDGNLVIYKGGKAIWASWTVGKGGASLIMQGDGNLVMYTAGGKAVWSSGTYGHPGAVFAMQDDGNGVIYEAGKAIWATNTAGK